MNEKLYRLKIILLIYDRHNRLDSKLKLINKTRILILKNYLIIIINKKIIKIYQINNKQK